MVLREFAIEMAIGTAAGLAGAFLFVRVLRGIHLKNETLYPVFALVLAGLLYGVTALAHGSGFLAVFIFGLVLGNVRRRTSARSSASIPRSRLWPS